MYGFKIFILINGNAGVRFLNDGTARCTGTEIYGTERCTGTARYGTARYSTINMVLQGVHFLAPLLFFLFFPALLIGVRFQENPDF